MKSLSLAALSMASLLALAPGCALDLSDDPYGPRDPGPPTPPPPPVTARGTYELRSQIDITVAAVLPEPAYELVGTLHDFSTAPAHTLFDLAEAAGVPAVAELRAALPAVLEDRLEGWLDDQIEGVELGGVPVTQVAAELAALGETALGQVALDSELALAPTEATHRLRRIDFAPAGLAAAFSLDDLPADLTTAAAPIGRTADSLELGDHRFGLPYGRYAWQALEAAATAQYGDGLRDLLGAAVDCPAVSAAVANQCVLGVCVGHRAELTALCERGLDEVVAVAQRKVEAVRFDALRFEAGSAALVDATGDRIADRLTGGTWSAQIDASQGLRRVPATFTGERR